MAGANPRSTAAGDGLLDMEKELTCSICTDILYQPLTLLDCLHTFCGSCLKEWFAWQATSAAAKNSRNPHPYTCPSCRESVRGTKADWRLNTLLEGFLKANPDRVKSEQEREEMRQSYTPGEDVLPKVEVRQEESDSEDERLMAQVRELSMAHVDPESARRRAERSTRQGRRGRREEERGGGGGGGGGGGRGGATYLQYGPEASGHRQQTTRRASPPVQLTESRLEEHGRNEAQLEHQSSLRSLLSASPIENHDVQQEILQSIYADGLLDGIDIDNLTTEQEEELTERIADAYRRRQRRERSRHRERRRSPRPGTSGSDTQAMQQRLAATPAPLQPRSRPPVSRPHLFEQTNLGTGTRHVRSSSATSQQGQRSASRTQRPSTIDRASRSATDLSERPSTDEAARARQRRPSSNARRTTDPQDPQLRAHISHVRASSRTERSASSEAAAAPAHPLEAARQHGRPTNNSSPSLVPPAPSTQQTIRPTTSAAAFAPESITSVTPAPEPLSNLSSASEQPQAAPAVTCTRCERPNLQYDLHYHCPWCRNGNFDLCLSCYRQGQGCDHWYGFGYMAYERWRRLAPPEGWPAGYERPHVLVPRRWQKPSPPPPPPSSTEPNTADPSSRETTAPLLLQEGAFCDRCFAFTNTCYWYCHICLEGAWGFCNACVQTGQTCTHPLLPVAHLSTSHHHQPHQDPSTVAFTQMPHLRLDTYLLLPVLTDCDICHRPIPPNRTRFHCYVCSNGDYDICTECYYSLSATGKIGQGDGPGGWRRCLRGHRLAVVGYQDMPEASAGGAGGGQQRVVVRDLVGGRRHKEDDGSDSVVTGAAAIPPPPPEDSSLGARCLALWSYFPPEGVEDEVAFPKNAEVTEVEDMNGDWSIGVYAGKVGLFPSNHVRRI
ncbi:hypothetical protein KC331_g2807 [Hortaea werneckii]|uniref:RING-type domain-containing protein n=1 Tax=Hortaea werneckii TaxID=91943 RepID=A0A3M7BY77_HORWE|nr:hypothetical protein KC331_g2807 [Hortaea werneckii]KAI7720005.1 hypothetical protein KC353_g2519 [Hortaea werneckii]RMY44769.1 hypothetical protein D0865_10340 [Hortaea werneckii]